MDSGTGADERTRAKPRGPRRVGGRYIVPDYGPSTPATQKTANQHLAGELARRRMKPKVSIIPRPGGGLNVFDRNSYLIGTKESEDSPTHRVTPRKLGVRGQS
jgi:hypothetical protein